MDVSRISTAALLGLAMVVAPGAWAQTTGAEKSQTPAVDPNAIGRLKAMGQYLRSLKTFQVNGQTTTDSVLQNGQLAESSSTVTAVARVPSRLLVHIAGNQGERDYYYDGEKLTVVSPDDGYYAERPAPPTIGELATSLDEKNGIELPLVDLFRWGSADEDKTPITLATDLGPAEVEGTTCEHYAFRQAGLDWQVWIQRGDYPLPRKLVLSTLTDDARPRHTVVYTWNLAPSVNEQAFTFVPPPDAKRVVLAEVPKARVPPKARGQTSGRSR